MVPKLWNFLDQAKNTPSIWIPTVILIYRATLRFECYFTKIFREILKTAGIFDAMDVEQRGAAGRGRFGNAATLQMKAPTVKKEKQIWSKEEIKKEEVETKQVLERLTANKEKFIVYDPALKSDPKLNLYILRFISSVWSNKSAEGTTIKWRYEIQIYLSRIL